MKTSFLIFIFLFPVLYFSYLSCNIKESDVENNEGKQVSITHNNDFSSQSGNIDNSKYSGLYQGVYFYIAEATTTRLEKIYPVLLINDTCSLLYFGKTLIKDFKIVNNVIKYPSYSFVGGGDTNKIYIDKSEVKIPYNDYEIKYNMSSDSEKYESADGKIYKISELSDRDFLILNEAIKENNNFFKYFWRNFIEALEKDNINFICDHIHFPFIDHYGEIYPVFSKKSPLSADNKAEFIKVYPKIFTKEVKIYLNNNLPRKILGTDVYNIDVESQDGFFRKFFI